MCLGTPGQIVRYDDDAHQVATVDFAGTQRSVNTAMVAGDADPPAPGDWVMVHMGIALHQMDPQDAADTQVFFDDLLADFERVAAAREETG
ncbi:HypC/HybG/HupF family hydrogenase formation chaperone [soil metagenome]